MKRDVRPCGERCKGEALVREGVKERAALLGEPFEEMYADKYPQLSWYTHAAGLAGFDPKASSYEKLATTHHSLAVHLYKLLLRAIIDEYQF